MSAKAAGGTFDVRTADGKRGALLASAPTGNSLILYKSDGNEAVSVVGGDVVSAITLGKLSEATAERPAAQLTNLPGFGGNLILRNDAGQDAVELSGGPESGEIAVWGADPESRVKINTAGGGGTVIASRAGAPSAVHLTAAEHGGLVIVKAEDDSAALGATSKGGSLTIVKEGHPRAFMGVGDEPRVGTILLTNADDTPAVNLVVTEHGGRMLLSGADGTTQIGCGASDEGGQISLFNELAVERATIRSKADGGGIHLKWGGTTGLIAAATERGGVVLTHNAEGDITDSLPNPPFPDGEGE
jgi:hypothetical protein